MSLREAAAAVEAKLPGPKCGVYIYRMSLTPDDREFFDGLLISDRTAEYISDVVTEAGGELSSFTIRRHRNRRCSCP